MARRSESDAAIPWRVVAIAAVLLLALGVGAWWIARVASEGASPDATTQAGTGEQTGSAADDAAGTTPTAETTGPEPGAEGVEPGQEPAAGTPASARPPGDPETPTGETDAATLASLAPARAVRGSMSVQLFLVRPRLERLVPVMREVDAPHTLASQVERVVEELIEWAGTDMTSPLPPQTVIHEVFVSPAGIAYVDFGASFPEALDGGSLAELHAVYGIVASITESFPEIHAVQILVDHREVDTLIGHVDLSEPLVASSEWVIRPAGSSRPSR